MQQERYESVYPDIQPSAPLLSTSTAYISPQPVYHTFPAIVKTTHSSTPVVAEQDEITEAVLTLMLAVMLSIVFFFCLPGMACFPYLLLLKYKYTNSSTVKAIQAIAFTLFITCLFAYGLVIGGMLYLYNKRIPK